MKEKKDIREEKRHCEFRQEELTAIYFASVSASGVDHCRFLDCELNLDVDEDVVVDAGDADVDVHLRLRRRYRASLRIT